MWSHYANNHKGVCLEFDFDTENNRRSLFEIKYYNQIQTLHEVEINSSGDLALNIYTNGKFLTQKLKTWKLRMLRMDGDHKIKGVLGDYPGKLTTIYFGKNSTIDEIDRVKTNTKHFPRLKFNQVNFDSKTAKMDIINEL